MLSHISGHPSATSRVQDSESTSAEDQCPTAGPRNQQTIGNILSRKTWATWVMGRFTDGSRVTKYDPLSARGAIYCSGCGGDKRNCPAVRLDPLISRAAVWHVTARPWRHQPAGRAECARGGRVPARVVAVAEPSTSVLRRSWRPRSLGHRRQPGLVS